MTEETKQEPKKEPKKVAKKAPKKAPKAEAKAETKAAAAKAPAPPRRGRAKKEAGEAVAATPEAAAAPVREGAESPSAAVPDIPPKWNEGVAPKARRTPRPKKGAPEGGDAAPAAEVSAVAAPAGEESPAGAKGRRPRKGAKAKGEEAQAPAAESAVAAPALPFPTDEERHRDVSPAAAGEPSPEGGREGAPPRAEAGEGGKRRRRRRRRGKGGGGAEGHEAERPQGAGAPLLEVYEGEEREEEEDEEAAPGEGSAEGDGFHEGEGGTGGEGEKKRRRRRRRRRRGKGGAAGTEGSQPQEGEAPPPPGADVPTEGADVPGTPLEAAEEGEAGTGRGRRRRRRGKGRGEEGQPSRDGAAPERKATAPPRAEEEDQEDEGPLDDETEYVEPAGDGKRKVMLIDAAYPEEVRVVVVSDSTLDFLELENQRRKLFKGNIYRGRVVNIAHAIEAAFVEFGGGRHGFLPLNEYCGGALIENLGNWNEGDKRPPLRPGVELLVQVTKEESDIKGAALTSYISIAGRYLVMSLGMKRYGISKKIAGDKERDRIRKQMEKLDYPENLGFIVRTVGAGRPLKDLKADLENLVKIWERTVAGARTCKAPALLYEEQDIVIRTLRDHYSSDIAEVLMNTEDSLRKATDFFDVYYPKEKGKLKVQRQKRPLFSKFNLEEQVERAVSRKVPLPSGGSIIIDKTEALWSIDVNSGRSSKDRDIEDTAFRTNVEAAAEVTRQLRLRDMGGLIVVDFIDLDEKKHLREVDRVLKEGLKRDKAKTDVTSMGKFGLVGISRQRMGSSFHDVLMTGCERCGTTGFVPTADCATVRLLRKVHDELSREGSRDLVARVSPAILQEVVNRKREEVSRLEKLCGGRVSFQADPSLLPEEFFVTAAPPAPAGNP
jgi:ribonuclease E